MHLPRRSRHSALLIAGTLAAVATAAGCGDSGSDDSAQAAAGGPIPAVATPKPPAGVGVFPVPGTLTASPQTQISVRGVAPGKIGTLTVTGSKTGAHPGKLEAHSDGNGASFLPTEPFSTKGETVTVKTALPIAGADGGQYSFTVVERPKTGLQSDPTAIPPKLLKALTGQSGKVEQGDATFKSRRDLRPPAIEILKKPKGTAKGLIFLSPKIVFGAKRPKVQNGPMILDDRGRPVWFASTGNNTPAGNANRVNDFRVQNYKGEPALTYWQGRQILGTGEGVVRIVGKDYRTIKTVEGGNGYKLDFHEARLTDQGTLLGIVFNPINADLSSVGGPKKGRAVDAVVQEIDIQTGLVLFEWHSWGNISLKESYEDRLPKNGKEIYDYVHPNSASIGTDGNVLLSGRELWSALRLNRTTGALMARIGGKKSDYKMLGKAQYAYQHDVEQLPDGTLSVYDNEAAPQVRDQSRGLLLNIDEKKRTVSVQAEFKHQPKPITSGTQGSVQLLPNGNHFVEWGSQGYFSEFTAEGKMLFDGRIARGQDSYRGYRSPWVGIPGGRPSSAVVNRSAYASWNGSTEITRWKLLTGDAKDGVTKVIGTARSQGFETRITMKSPGKYIAMQAVDAGGKVLGTSRPVTVKTK